MKINGLWIGLLSIITGAVAGSLILKLTENVTWLSWLAYGTEFGISTAEPFVLDLALIKISLGIMVNVNVTSITCIVLALLLYRKILSE